MGVKMGRFTLRLPKSLHEELEDMAGQEGVSLNQYIVYALAQQVTTEKFKHRILPDVRPVNRDDVLEQYRAFEQLKAELGQVATEEEVDRYLSGREPAKPEAELITEAIGRFEARIKRAKQMGRGAAA